MSQTLPNETLIEIFKNLSHSELLKVSEVSKRFYDAATDPSLWKDFNISNRSLEDKIKILQLSRCKKLKTLKLRDSDGGVNNDILRILMKIGEYFKERGEQYGAVWVNIAPVPFGSLIAKLPRYCLCYLSAYEHNN